MGKFSSTDRSNFENKYTIFYFTLTITNPSLNSSNLKECFQKFREEAHFRLGSTGSTSNITIISINLECILRLQFIIETLRWCGRLVGQGVLGCRQPREKEVCHQTFVYRKWRIQYITIKYHMLYFPCISLGHWVHILGIILMKSVGCKKYLWKYNLYCNNLRVLEQIPTIWRKIMFVSESFIINKI